LNNKQVVIIGAGPAGLTTAFQLLKNSEIKPIVLEESEFVGGISRTAVYKNNRMDLGGHRFFTKNEQVMNIWKKLMRVQGAPSRDDILLNRNLDWSKDGPDPETDDRVLLKRNRVSRIFYLKKFFDYPIALNIKTFANMGLARTMKAGLGYLGSTIHKRQENSLEDFYINRFGKPLYEMFFEDYTEKLWGIHPSQIAPDWGAQRVKGLSLFKVITSFLTKTFRDSSRGETSLIEEFYYPKFGPGQLWETMAGEISKMGGQIVLNTSVEKLDFSNGNCIKLQARNKDGEKVKYTASAVFSSMPIKDLLIAMDDVPPREVAEIATALPYRDFITVGLLLKKLLIKNETKLKTVSDIVPDCWIYIQERDVKLGRLQIFNNWSPYLVNKPEDTVWIGLEYFCNEGDEKWNMKSEDFINFAVDELEKIDVIRRADVLDSTMIRVKKAYPAYFGSYESFDKVKAYLNTLDNLYCIGRNGQHRYNNMDHSMLTAIEAVNCYLNNSKYKDAIWNVNAEEEYHETKSN
jgi:UDP-galactopyranose mutase (EC 5.4.99.9)